MPFDRRTVLGLLAGNVAGLAVSRGARAQTYPSRPVRIITTAAPGGTIDVLARVIADKLSVALGQNVHVEGIPGGASRLGIHVAARAAPDGHTILFVYNNFFTDISLYAKPTYDPIRDFSPVTLIASSPFVLLVNPSLPVHSVGELVALAKASPGRYSYAAPGNLVDEMFMQSFRLDVVRVPFNSAPPAIASTMGGHTQIAFTSLGVAAALIRDGKLRALAVTSSKRSSELPDVPTLAEAGAPGHEALFVQGAVVPAGTPRAIIDRLQAEIARIARMPDVVARMAALGCEPVANSPEQFADYIRTEIARWADVIRKANLRIE